MFGAIKEQWRSARGTELRKEMDDIVARMGNAPDVVGTRCALVLAENYKALDVTLGPLENVSDAGKRKIGKDIVRRARRAFDYDLGQAYGLAILGLYIESQGLPGADAAFARQILQHMVNASIETAERFAEATKDGRLP